MARYTRRRGTRKYRRGVPRGYRHHWNYTNARWHENKVAPGLWNVTFTSVKRRRGRKARYHKGAPPRGTRILWKINGYQQARKLSDNSYATKFVGRKKLVYIKR